MLLTLLVFLFSAVTIYVACDYFVNAIEWVGRRLQLGATAVGSVLAAFGTALPESAVTFTAVVFGQTPEQKELGIGAAMGGPLVLATLAYAVVGLTLWWHQRQNSHPPRPVQADYLRLRHDQGAFLLVFIVKVALGLVTFAVKPWLGSLFLAAYALYVWREIHTADTAPDEASLEPLKLQPTSQSPTLTFALLQVGGALIVIAFASHLFVAQLETIGHFMNWPPHRVALLLSPVATELPEIMNALIWVRQGKERLALANISGAMMIQATIPSALGIFFTPWQFDTSLLLAGLVTAAAICYVWCLFRRGAVYGLQLLFSAGFYAVFIIMLIYY